MNENTSGWRARVAALWARTRPKLRRGAELAAIYFDDLLMLGAGVCFVTAAAQFGGRPWAVLTAGVCLLGYAIVVARAGKRGGGG